MEGVILYNITNYSAGYSLTRAAWLSSARVVRCAVSSTNERNPHIYLLKINIRKRSNISNKINTLPSHVVG